MSTPTPGRAEASKRMAEIIPLLSLWTGENIENIEAHSKLNAILEQARKDLGTMYDAEIIAVIRASSSARNFCPAWLPLLREIRALFMGRHGLDQTNRLLVGLKDDL